jgi:hypothetical protein
MKDLPTDQLLELDRDKLPVQLRWKLERAEHHFDDFQKEVGNWINAPGKMVPTSYSTAEDPWAVYEPSTPVPPTFNLIAGDFLQNLRSVLDYLVWHMVIANGNVPNMRNTAFPVCRSSKAWNECYKKKLAGIPDEAIAIIEKLQPYPERQNGKAPSALEVLDELNNENKHRRVLLPALISMFKPAEEVPFPHIEFEVYRTKGSETSGQLLVAFLAFENEIVKSIEVSATLNVLKTYVHNALPFFEKFF